jgi:hypothetical protein
MANLTALEAAVLKAIAAQLGSKDHDSLSSQIDGLAVKSRENSGAGFFTHFETVDRSKSRILADTRDCHVSAEINGDEGSLGFILWLRDGYVDFLEGYTESLADTVGLSLDTLSFVLVEWPRKLDG